MDPAPEQDPLDQPFEIEAPAPPEPVPSRAPLLTFAGTIAMLVALFIPWATTPGEDRIAFDSLEGKIAGGLVLLSILLASAVHGATERRARRSRALRLLAVAGILCLVGNAYLVRLLAQRPAPSEGPVAPVRVGLGPLALIAGAVVLAFGASRAFREARTGPSPAARKRPPPPGDSPKNLDGPPPPD